MSAVEDIREITPFQGLRYNKRVFVVDAANEARLMGHCGIDPATFKGAADPVRLHQLRDPGGSAQRHLLQRRRQHGAGAGAEAARCASTRS